jgi:hypothetical protein
LGGGVAVWLGTIGNLARSCHLAIRSIKFICDNYAAIWSVRRGLTPSVFHRTEIDFNLIETIKYLEKEWCHNIDISYEWVKGITDRLNHPFSQNESLNIETNALADIIQMEVNGSTVETHECAHWELETVSLRINGSKITSNMKQKLQAQLHEGELRDYILEREERNEETFNNISWEAHGTAFCRLSRNRRIAISKACYNLWYTGVRHQLYYHEVRPLCMCHNQVEDRRHVIACPSNRAESWSKVKKSMERWKLPNDIWIVVEQGMLYYTEKPT